MLLKPKQVSDRLNVSLSTVYGLVESGRLGCHRIGQGRGAIRISEDDLAAYLQACHSATPKTGFLSLLQQAAGPHHWFWFPVMLYF